MFYSYPDTMVGYFLHITLQIVKKGNDKFAKEKETYILAYREWLETGRHSSKIENLEWLLFEP